MLRCLLLLSTSAAPPRRGPGTSGSTRTAPRPPSPAAAVALATAESSPPARARTGLPEPRESGGPPANGAEPPRKTPLAEIAEGPDLRPIGANGIPLQSAADVPCPIPGEGGCRWSRRITASANRARDVPAALATDQPRPPHVRRVRARTPRLPATSEPASDRDPRATRRDAQRAHP